MIFLIPGAPRCIHAELQTPSERPKAAKGDSDSEDEGELADKISDLTLDKSAEAVFNENSRVSMFFTHEDNQRVSYTMED